MERYDLNLPVQIWCGNNHDVIEQDMGFFTTRNICAGGAFFETERPLQAGTKLNARIQLSFGPVFGNKKLESIVNVSGMVLRVEEDGMAVQFNPQYEISSV